MTLSDILDSVRQLSQNDKLALIEATAQMLRQALDDNGDESVEAIAEVAALYRVHTIGGEVSKRPVQSSIQISSAHSRSVEMESLEINLDDYFCDDTREEFLAEMRNFLTMPNPEPEQMIQSGMFKGRIPVDDEYFKMAEWHPSEEELAGDG